MTHATIKVAEHRSSWKPDKRYLAGLVWRWWSQRLHELNWNARYKRWLVEHRPSIYADRFQFYAAVQAKTFGFDPILFLEFGVYQGDSIKKWAELSKHEYTRLWGFDSFEGLPLSDPPFIEGSLDVIDPPTFEDGRIKLVPGWFNETLPEWLNDTWVTSAQLVVHIDCDLYSSTLYVLTMLDRYLVPGSIVIFDETSCAHHEFRALIDWTSSYRRSYDVLAGFKSGRRVEGVAIQIRE